MSPGFLVMGRMWLPMNDDTHEEIEIDHSLFSATNDGDSQINAHSIRSISNDEAIAGPIQYSDGSGWWYPEGYQDTDASNFYMEIIPNHVEPTIRGVIVKRLIAWLSKWEDKPYSWPDPNE